MAQHWPAILLLFINMGLLWLLMAAPLGLRTLRRQSAFRADAHTVWSAVSPLGSAANWHHSVLRTEILAGSPTRVVQAYTHLDREGQPILRTLAVSERASGGCDRKACDIRVIDDSALDAAFWKDYRETRRVETKDAAVLVTIEQTDRYRGCAVLIFRFFALRREMRALGRWLETGSSAPTGLVFEHPLVQMALGLASTLMLWPFFGLTVVGLTISCLLTVVIVLHEFGHMAAYRAFGHKTVRMIFVPLLGGIAIGGRPYNSVFEVATCALMGAGVSAFFVPIAIAVNASPADGRAGAIAGAPVLVFLLILGAFNLLNLLPMNRFDGGQVLRQVFRTPATLAAGSFLVTLVIAGVGWRIGLPTTALLSGLAVFTLLSFMGQGGVKPRHRLEEMSSRQRVVIAIGLYAALLLHAYAIVYATERLFPVS